MENETQDNIQFIEVNLSSLDECPRFYGSNYEISYYINNNQEWVNYGISNDLPYWLASMANQSATHKSLLRLKATLTAGDGFLINEENIKLKQFIEDLELNRVLKEVALERVIYNAHALEIIFSKGRTKIADINSISCTAVRVQNSPLPEYYFVSPDWRQYRKAFYQPMKIHSYNPTVASDFPQQILHDFEKFPGNHFYGIEDYRSGLKFIQAEAKLGNFWLSTLSNGMVPSGILSINKNPGPEQRAKFKREFLAQHAGDENAGKVLVAYYDKDETPPSFTPIATHNTHEIHDTLNNIITQKIISCHSLSSPALAGLPGDSGVFSNSFSTAFEYFSNTIIKNYQDPILYSFAKLFKQNGLIESMDEIRIKPLNPIQFKYSENVLLSILSKNEIRATVGYPQRSDGNSLGNSPVQTQQPYIAPNGIAPKSNTPGTPNTPSISNSN